MPRFTATLTGTAPNQVLTVIDTGVTPNRTVIVTSENLHQPGGGGSPALANAAISVSTVETEFDTPVGPQMEMGFELHFDLSAPGGGSAKEVGLFRINGIKLGSPYEFLDTYKFGSWTALSITTSQSKEYPNGTYSPLIVGRNATQYNLCAAMCYALDEWNHPFHIETGLVGSDARWWFEARNQPASGSGFPRVWATIEAGQTRRYTVRFRINDRTDTSVTPDGPTEWIWTLRGYQEFFRRRFGKPNYRGMGGWDGRPICSMNSSTSDVKYDRSTNPRSWDSDTLNPTTTTAGVPGYEKFANVALSKQALNLQRIVIWAISGWHPPLISITNYPFRIGTGVAELNVTATGTIQPALRRVREGSEQYGAMQQGLWWGRSVEVDLPTENTWWSGPTGFQMDPDDAELTGAAFKEADIAVFEWGTKVLGLDQFIWYDRPYDGYRWLRMLKARYPRVLFVTEQALPDYLHTLVPTFVTEDHVGDLFGPLWLREFINPGGETWVQIKNLAPGVTEAMRATELAEWGLDMLAGFLAGVDAGTRGTPRCTDLGETPITESRRAVAASGSWRDRDLRDRMAVR